MSASENESDKEPWVYIHLPSTKVGEKYSRLAVKASCVKKFDYFKYQENPNAYHNVPLKYRASKGEEKKNCFVLLAAVNHKKLDDAVKKSKRFPVPSSNIVFNTTNTTEISDTTPIVITKTSKKRTKKPRQADVADNEDEEIDVKKARKSARKLIKDVANENAETILNNHIRSQQPMQSEFSSLESNAEFNSFRLTPASTSTPLRQRQLAYNFPNNEQDTETQAIISAYKQQVEFFKNRCLAAESELQKVNEKYEKLQRDIEKGAANSSTSQPDDTLAELDQIFSGNDETENPSLKQLQKGVMCKSSAHREAMKSEKVSKFFSAICVGVYGKDDFATRCVVRRSDNMDQRELSPTKTEAIDAEFYRWMKIHKFTPLQITQNLAKCNTYYHNAITAVRRRKHQEENSSNITTVPGAPSTNKTKRTALQSVELQSNNPLGLDSVDKEVNPEDPLAVSPNISRSSTPARSGSSSPII